MLSSKNRPRWNELPQQVRDQIEQLAGGRVLAAENCEGGFSAGFASRLTLTGGRRAFAKAMDGAAWPLQAGWCRDEARVSAGLPAGIPAPRLRGWSDDGQWVALVFECIEGREPARPWQPDELGRAATAVSAMSLALTPSPVPVAADQPRIGGWAELAGDRTALGRLPGVSVRAAGHLAELIALERAGLAAAHGTSLVHFDVLPHNILCAGQQVWFVDWPHARLGAPFIDLLMLLASAGCGRHRPGRAARRAAGRSRTSTAKRSTRCSPRWRVSIWPGRWRRRRLRSGRSPRPSWSLAAALLAGCSAGSGGGPDYQYWVVAPELLYTLPVPSGCSNTDWIATRPGPCRVSQIDLACQRAELNQ